MWNDAEAPEPPANLTATLKGAVIHRFCETFCEGDNAEVRLRESFEHVRSMRRAQLAGRELGIDDATAVADLLPLAQNYLASEVFRRVLDAARINVEENSHFAIRSAGSPAGQAGWGASPNPSGLGVNCVPRAAAGNSDWHNRQTADHASRKRLGVISCSRRTFFQVSVTGR